MTVRSKWGVIVAAFVIGLVAGVSLDLLRPNTITFIVRANGKVNLVPQVGDVITWVAEASTNNSVKSGWPVAFDTTFEKGVPCKEIIDPNNPNPVTSCTVVDYSAPYAYDCNTDDTSQCSDPGVGPHSGTGGHVARFEFLLKILKYRFLESFGLHSQLKNFWVEPAINSSSPTVKLDQPGRIHNPLIRCISGRSAVSPIDANPSNADRIEWGSAGEKYHFSLPDPSADAGSGDICTEGQTFNSANPHAICTPTNASPGKHSYVVHFDDGSCPDFIATLMIEGNSAQSPKQ
ncbi:MAG: hypothetical protein WA869_22820 [Alloacidobacterium sp.]|jgi:hypothetical protein